ncbi:hypothetical protein TPHA_0B03670 [Tetrapisispora phaffii CBS 4417]|uniref:SGF29 C-terminal domain-containing protein n=1 Tax=Tetrapisispora phaffii (strain ATCC 24235 / CBS 4417 / NBRC 1672 / NRRL Y-8282 / UCD 70-5) TaxID=1071381 RepID=G8BPV8_TETPH|nr:hypothetical protein TPHA_0B03670 [Tetrapisispora phaffii CBS 4417]CCE62039.1 hypothetical protein TPHA_0B03670 [Tetrapisispora phaffii CBS 4417]
MENQWNSVVSSLQDIYNANEVNNFDEDVALKELNFNDLSNDSLTSHITQLQEHMENVNRAKRLLSSIRENLNYIINDTDSKNREDPFTKIESTSNASSSTVTTRAHNNTSIPNNNALLRDRTGETATGANTRIKQETHTEPITPAGKNNGSGTNGKIYWVSQYNAITSIKLGSNVAYKPKKSIDGEWFHCEVVKISIDGLRFEVKDPEPDEFGNPGKIFKCTWKDIILIPPENATKAQMPNYPTNTRVLARYPETTTFYPAIIISTKRDGTCRLKFDGEEEVDRETELPRRYVLPLPNISAKPFKK